jgi:hypothetical protein
MVAYVVIILQYVILCYFDAGVSLTSFGAFRTDNKGLE